MLNHENLSDHVAKIIRKMILNGTLKPGDKVNQAQLAESLNISRGPIREALHLLQNEGLIKHETNKGTHVTTLSAQDAYEIYSLRALLESKAAELAMMNLTPAEFTQLEKLLEEFRTSLFADDLEKEAICDINFHKVIVKASHHQRLIRMHEQLDIQVGAMFLTVVNKLPVRATKVVENHQKLLDALRSSDRARVAKEFSEHYIHTLNELKDAQGQLTI
ncbi:GntR family transcriptional regulator [Neobacillus notoginsengisoli]|uniref:GntR family transcriptional regulator n=1 Tax=Neobacillus notoginsengisoli TaxID=1578198 RepID=A0A417YRW3_9BACI|nr:GntR family transcriptional regulator [Neobacillus notoginsengisoli]RHW38031.1 GntR family transcriptional regulator [Neobacillus notoginsengisoli]